jgi:hypothetical protein
MGGTRQVECSRQAEGEGARQGMDGEQHQTQWDQHQRETPGRTTAGADGGAQYLPDPFPMEKPGPFIGLAFGEPHQLPMAQGRLRGIRLGEALVHGGRGTAPSSPGPAGA